MQPVQTAATVLSERQRRLLKIVVAEYVSSAVPVGSGTILRRHDLGVSPATVRNDLATLEAIGFLWQPHTSAGRLPTELGYRFFVEHLLDAAQLPESERAAIRRQFGVGSIDLERWAQIAASAIARAVHNTALVMLPMGQELRLRDVELVSIHDRAALMIVVLENTLVRQAVVDLPHATSEAALRRVARRLSGACRGLPASEIEALPLDDLAPLEQAMRARLLELMRPSHPTMEGVWVDGFADMVRQPEFADAERLRPVLDTLQDRAALAAIAPGLSRSDGVRVLIGRENPLPGLVACALIVAPYGSPSRARGIVGVLGPTRIEYGRAISMVRYVAALFDRLYADVGTG